MKAVLDTYPLIKFFKDELGAGEIQKVLEKMERGELEGLISTVTLSEVFYILAMYKSIKFAETAIKYIKLNLKGIGVSEQIALKGGEYKLKYAKGNMPLADAIIAATAFQEGATLISNEEHFRKIKDLSFKTPKEILKEEFGR